MHVQRVPAEHVTCSGVQDDSFRCISYVFRWNTSRVPGCRIAVLATFRARPGGTCLVYRGAELQFYLHFVRVPVEHITCSGWKNCSLTCDFLVHQWTVSYGSGCRIAVLLAFRSCSGRDWPNMSCQRLFFLRLISRIKNHVDGTSLAARAQNLARSPL